MRRRNETFRLTFPALMAALSLALLYVSAVLPTGHWGVAAAAGLFPAAAVCTVGLWGGVGCYAAVAVLGLLLVPDRLVALLYALFFGLYPVVKSPMEQIKNRWLSLSVKIVYFNAVLTLFYLVFSRLFLPALPQIVEGRGWLLYLAGNVIFLVYDFGLTKLIAFYQARIGKAISHNT